MGRVLAHGTDFEYLVAHRSGSKVEWEWDLADALSARNDLDAYECSLVIRLLRTRAEDVVRQAINLLSRAGVKEALGAIWRCRCQWDCLVRVAQLEATWDLGGSGFEPLVRRRLADRHCLVRQWAADVYAARYPVCARILFPRLLRRERALNVRVRLLLAVYAWGDRARLGPALDILLEPDLIIRSMGISSIAEVAAPEDLEAEIARLRSRLAAASDGAARGHLADLLAAVEEEFGPGSDYARERKTGEVVPTS